MPDPIYFDHAATSPMPAEVLAAYTEELRQRGNPSSLHAAGQAARMRLEAARESLASHVGADPAEIIFTSGGTEADNLALKGIYLAQNGGSFTDPVKPCIALSPIEHHAVLDTAEWLESQGATLLWLPVDGDGVLDLAAAKQLIGAHHEQLALVSVMYANNEIGTLQPIAELVQIAAQFNVPVHSDAVQALGQVPVDFGRLGLSAMTVTAHKVGGPVGIGALVLARNLTPVPVIHGGGQERSVRSGTLDVAGAVAFAAAADVACADLAATTAAMSELRDKLIAGIEATVPDATLTGPRGQGRLPGNVHFTFAGAEGDSLLFGLDARGFQTSTGSACQAGVSRPSHVLLGLGASEDRARSTQRFSLGKGTSAAEVDALLAALPEVVSQARAAGMVSATPRWLR